MTNQQIAEAMQQLTESLQVKLLTLEQGKTLDDFSSDEQLELGAKFGTDWPVVLGLT